jgi:hypothetical protein
MKKLLAAIMVVCVLAQCGSLSQKSSTSLINEFFATATFTRTPTFTASKTFTPSKTSTRTPTMSCDQLSVRWVHETFLPAREELLLAVSAQTYNDWVDHSNEYVALTNDTNPPQCSALLVNAANYMNTAITITSLFYPDYLSTGRTRGGLWLFLQQQRALEDLDELYAKIIVKYSN